MNTPPDPPMPPSVDRVFLALVQTLYTCQLFEATMLELLATAHEVLKGTADETQFQASADIRPDIDAQLNAGLETRNFVVHRFSAHVGDDLVLDRNILDHQQALYEKCGIIMEANSTALSVLQALGRLHSDRSSKAINELEQAADALREFAHHYSGAKY